MDYDTWLKQRTALASSREQLVELLDTLQQRIAEATKDWADDPVEHEPIIKVERTASPARGLRITSVTGAVVSIDLPTGKEVLRVNPPIQAFGKLIAGNSSQRDFKIDEIYSLLKTHHNDGSASEFICLNHQKSHRVPMDEFVVGLLDRVLT